MPGPSRAEILAILAQRNVQIPQAEIKATEDQGKSQAFARLMSDAESSYARAVSEGYNPGSLQNSAAALAEGLPFGGLDGLGSLIRDKVGDRARQAELQWSDAQLKSVSGAASPEAEVKRGVKTYFPRPGENFQDINPQKARAREVAFTSARTRSGPLAPKVGLYPTEPGYSAGNPIDLSMGESRTTIPKGAFYIDQYKNLRKNENFDAGNPKVDQAGRPIIEGRANKPTNALTGKSKPVTSGEGWKVVGKE